MMTLVSDWNSVEVGLMMWEFGCLLCIMSVEGSDVTLPSGEIQSSFVIGMKMLNISLQVVSL